MPLLLISYQWKLDEYVIEHSSTSKFKSPNGSWRVGRVRGIIFLIESKIVRKTSFMPKRAWLVISVYNHTDLVIMRSYEDNNSDNKNNSAVLVGRKHFRFQKSIGKESDPIFHLRQITITEQKSAHLVSCSDIYFHQPLLKVRSHT